MTQVIEARGLNKSYGALRALADLSLTVEPGAIDTAYHSDPNSQLAAPAVAMIKYSAN